MKHTAFLATALLGLTACSGGSTTSSPSTQPAPTTTIAQTTTTSTTTTPPTTTSTTTTTTTTTPATTVPPPTVDLAHPAETDTATWTLILNELYVRAAQMLNDPVNNDPSIYTKPDSSAFVAANSTHQRFLDEGLHFEGRMPSVVESVQSVISMGDGVVTVDFTKAVNDNLGRLVDANGQEVPNAAPPSTRQKLTWVLVPYDDVELPWRLSQVVD